MKETSMPVQNREEAEEIDLLELFRFYLSKAVLIIAAFVIGAVAAGAVTVGLITPKYTATSQLYMVSASTGAAIDLTDLNIGTNLSKDYTILMKIRPILEEVIDELKLDYNYKELAQMINVSAVNETRIIAVTTESTSPEEARDISNAIADKAVTYLPELMETPEPNIAERAILPEGKSSPSLSKNVMLGGMALMAICLAILTVIFLMDDTLKSAEDVEKALGVMPLTVVPEGNMHRSGEKKASDKKIKKAGRYGKSKRK